MNLNFKKVILAAKITLIEDKDSSIVFNKENNTLSIKNKEEELLESEQRVTPYLCSLDKYSTMVNRIKKILPEFNTNILKEVKDKILLEQLSSKLTNDLLDNRIQLDTLFSIMISSRGVFTRIMNYYDVNMSKNLIKDIVLPYLKENFIPDLSDEEIKSFDEHLKNALINNNLRIKKVVTNFNKKVTEKEETK